MLNMVFNMKIKANGEFSELTRLTMTQANRNGGASGGAFSNLFCNCAHPTAW